MMIPFSVCIKFMTDKYMIEIWPILGVFHVNLRTDRRRRYYRFCPVRFNGNFSFRNHCGLDFIASIK